MFSGIFVNSNVGRLIQGGDVVHGGNVDDERGRGDSVISFGAEVSVKPTVFNSDCDGGLTAEISRGGINKGLWRTESDGRGRNQRGVAAGRRDVQRLRFSTPGSDPGKGDSLLSGILENELISHSIDGGNVIYGIDGDCKRSGGGEVITRCGQIIVRTSVFNSDGNDRGAAEIGGRYKTQCSRCVG